MKQTLQTFEFPAETSVLPKIAETTQEICSRLGFSRETTGDILLALEEACNNTITHGLQADPNQTFQLEIKQTPEHIEFTIKEFGISFDPQEVPTPKLTCELNDRKVGGWGIYFMQVLMDSVVFEVADNGQKIICLRKNLPSR